MALVAPCGWVPPELVEAATRTLTGWGLRVRAGDNVLRRHFYPAGTDEERLADLDDAFRDPQVLSEQLGAFGVPLLGGLPFGHGEQQIALGLGVPAVLDADTGTLTVAPVAPVAR
nr:LD-carboxypeptidase [Actinoplanes rectilineatus]